MPYDLIDIGANLTHDSYDMDRDAVMQRARDAGVARMIITGSSNQGSLDALKLAESEPGRLYATAGVHPSSPETTAARQLTGPATVRIR